MITGLLHFRIVMGSGAVCNAGGTPRSTVDPAQVTCPACRRWLRLDPEPNAVAAEHKAAPSAASPGGSVVLSAG